MKTQTEKKTIAKPIKSVPHKIDKDKKYDDIIEFDTPPYKKRRRKLRDRYDGRYLISVLSAMKKSASPFSIPATFMSSAISSSVMNFAIGPLRSPSLLHVM